MMTATNTSAYTYYATPSWIDGSYVFTFSTWFKGAGFTFEIGNMSDTYWGCSASSGGCKIRLYYPDGSKHCTEIEIPPVVSASGFHHFAVTFNNGSYTYWLDGVASAPETLGATWMNTTSAGYPRMGLFNGQNGLGIAELAMWKKCLSAKQIAALSSGISPVLVDPELPRFYIPAYRDINEAITRSVPSMVNGTYGSTTHCRKAGV